MQNRYTRTFFLALWISCLMWGATPAHAQRWNPFKKGFLPSKVEALSVSAQHKIKRALLRAEALKRTSRFYEATFQNGRYTFRSPKALVPAVKTMTSVQNLPPFPFEVNPSEMYRGMVLDADGKQLRYILRRGMKVSKSHYNHYDAYNGKSYPSGTKAIYSAQDPRSAVFYLLKPKTRTTRYLPVIFHLKRVGHGYYISVPHDIPPQWIYRVSALLKINGRLTWGELQLDRHNNFVFTPYPPKAGEESEK